MATVAAADAGKIKVQIPAAEELASPFADDGPPSAVAPMVTVVVSPSYKKKPLSPCMRCTQTVSGFLNVSNCRWLH